MPRTIATIMAVILFIDNTRTQTRTQQKDARSVSLLLSKSAVTVAVRKRACNAFVRVCHSLCVCAPIFIGSLSGGHSRFWRLIKCVCVHHATSRRHSWPISKMQKRSSAYHRRVRGARVRTHKTHTHTHQPDTKRY